MPKARQHNTFGSIEFLAAARGIASSQKSSPIGRSCRTLNWHAAFLREDFIRFAESAAVPPSTLSTTARGAGCSWPRRRPQATEVRD